MATGPMTLSTTTCSGGPTRSAIQRPPTTFSHIVNIFIDFRISVLGILEFFADFFGEVCSLLRSREATPGLAGLAAGWFVGKVGHVSLPLLWCNVVTYVFAEALRCMFGVDI